jgi:hypothetical protein
MPLLPPCSPIARQPQRSAAFRLQERGSRLRRRRALAPAASFILLQSEVVSMQSAIQFPLTLTLSPEERESLSAIEEYSYVRALFPAPPMVSLSSGERVGVRGNGSPK